MAAKLGCVLILGRRSTISPVIELVGIEVEVGVAIGELRWGRKQGRRGACRVDSDL